MGDQWELYNQDHIGGTNEMGDQWELYNQDYIGGGTNEMGDQWELYNQGYIGGPMRRGTNESCINRVALGDQWDGGPMRTV